MFFSSKYIDDITSFFKLQLIPHNPPDFFQIPWEIAPEGKFPIDEWAEKFYNLFTICRIAAVRGGCDGHSGAKTK
jgi:hypothetical protein